MAPHCVKPELLAPAGTMTALRLAVAAGADAVYFGASAFHARRASQQTMVLKEVTDYCHLYGVKAYLTINISIKETELSAVSDLLREAFLAKIDALIITDLGILPLIAQHAPNIPLHASTQLGVAAKEGALFLKELGFTRVVLARECTVSDICAIKEVGLEIEYFVHGALCVGFSGACLMSSMIAGNSGNRGLCKQPCRQRYWAEAAGALAEGYLLSTKDQCLVLHLQELAAAGVDSFKIEGRLKRDAYQGGVTAIYRKALDGKTVTDEDFSALKRLFNRGNFTEGYAYEQKLIVYPQVQSSIGETVGKIYKVDPLRAYFKHDKPLSAKSGYKILRNSTETNISPKELTQIGQNSYALQNNGFKVGDELCITDDAEQDEAILRLDKKLKIDFFAEFLQGKVAKVVATSNEVSVEVLGDTPLAAATNAPMSANDLKLGLSKLGDTHFVQNEISVQTDGIFIAKSALNALRRQATDATTLALIQKHTPKYVHQTVRRVVEKPKQTGFFCQVDSVDKAMRVVQKPSTFMVFSPEKYQKEVVFDFVQAVKSANPNATVLLYTPALVTQNEINVLTELAQLIDGFICNNISLFYLAKSLGKIAVAGINLNIMNKNSPFYLESDAYMLSAELNVKEAKALPNGIIYAYGHLPLMNIKHCPLQTIGVRCADCKQNQAITFKDAKYTYPIKRFVFGKNCQFMLLNPVLADLGTYAYQNSVYLDFCQTDAESIDKIFEDYYNQKRERLGEYTLLHMKRGVL